ncbi:MAG TPA: lipoprotein-releasing ABC transporter permease subunit [Caulobacteraceae bacterium]
MKQANGSVAAPFSAWERSVAARYLRAKRKNGGVALISIISFVGIMLAVAVLIIVMSVMNGFRSELLGRILGFNGHAYVVGQPLNDNVRGPAVQRLRDLPGVIQVTPMVEAQAMAIGQGQIAGTIVRGVTPQDLRSMSIISKNIVAGSMATFGQGEYGGEELVIGERLASSLGVAPGDVVTLISPTGDATAFGSAPREKEYLVAATFSVGMSEYDQAFVYMPLTQAQLFFGRDTSVDVIELKLDNPDKARDMKGAIANAAGPGALVSDWTEKNQSFFDALMIERNVMRLILMMIVAIAAMNIISGLVMLVKNKGRDIAILRTIGAGQGAIMRIFFMAGASVGVLGTLVGLAIGALFCIYIAPIQDFIEWVTGAHLFSADVYYLSHIPAKIDWGEVALVTGWGLLMSFVATLPPAWRASRLDPVEALRYE